MQSIKEETIMEFFWAVENLKYVYKKHVSEYITHVLGHEGKNSLFSHLKMKGYASELSCYNHDIANQTLIGLEIKLTESGHENYEEVYNTVIDYACSMKVET
jgi:secreted Zn-dependent insulinase-like peptidase